MHVVYGNDDTTDGQLKQQIKLLSSYSLKALWFAMPMFYASLAHHYSTPAAHDLQSSSSNRRPSVLHGWRQGQD